MSRPSSEPAAAAPAAPPPAPKAAAPARRAPGFALFGPARQLLVRVGARQLQLEFQSLRGQPRSLLALSLAYTAADDESVPVMPTDLLQALAAVEPALAVLRAQLAERKLGSLRGAACHVTIDDSWMLYDVMRADLRSLAPRAADALIGASLADVAGVDASELASRWQPQGHGAYTLACGMPAAALPVLERALRSQGLAADSIEGEFVRTYNAQRARFDASRAVVALVRESGTQLGVLVDGVVAAMSFEFGVGQPRELELRGRGLLRVAGVGGEGTIHFYALAPESWKAPEPWVCLPLAA